MFFVYIYYFLLFINLNILEYYKFNIIDYVHYKIIVSENLPSMTWLFKFYYAKCSKINKTNNLLGRYLNEGIWLEIIPTSWSAYATN